jgi:hypothetical protein
LEVHLHQFKDTVISHKEPTKQSVEIKVFLTFLLDDRRIRIRIYNSIVTGNMQLLASSFAFQGDVQIFGSSLLSSVPTITASSAPLGNQKVITAKLAFTGIG